MRPGHTCDPCSLVAREASFGQSALSLSARPTIWLYCGKNSKFFTGCGRWRAKFLVVEPASIRFAAKISAAGAADAGSGHAR